MPDSAYTGSRESVLRFDLNAQRNRVLVYTAGFVTAVIGAALGVFPISMKLAVTVWVLSMGLATASYALFKRGVDRRLLNPVWMGGDILLCSVGIYATGGITSPWFIWYLAPISAAAFVAGRRATWVVGTANTAAYIGSLMLMGQAWLFNDIFLIALTRMIFLFGASYFFLHGIVNLQEKRQRVRQLEAEERRQLEELKRLTEELGEANRRIQEADRLKSQFLANMSHELRTPMNSIIGFSEILVERLDGKIDAKHVSFLRHIQASGQHLLGIINDILDLSKIEAGKMEIYPEYFEIRPVVESVCHVVKGMAKERPDFHVDMPADLPQIETDMAKFKQVLFNLLSNAVKFSPPHSPITISARYIGSGEHDGSIVVSVADEGIGIDPRHHEVIFQEFRQVDGTARREFGGTGLGLALVKKFVELQGGSVRVESSSGRGSTFAFTLPVRSRAAVVTRAEMVPEAPGVAERILVIEDDLNAYELIASALASAGYLPVRARHGDEAFRMARELRPTAITLDLVLPGLDGWDVLKKLKADSATCDIPVVIISVVDNRELGVALGADDYFIKPVDRARLLERLHQLGNGGDHGRPRLLVIDDDLDVHSLLDEELAPLGYALHSAMSGEDGLRAARENTPDVIILDLMMPGMSGFEVADSLKDDPLTADIPILVLTSKEISHDDRSELQSKVTSFVQKGKSARDQLLREIRRLEQRRSYSSS